jgi:hypothetical protein
MNPPAPDDGNDRREFLAVTSTNLLGLASLAPTADTSAPGPAPAAPQPVQPPPWVADVTRRAFVTPGQVEQAARAGVQVAHANVVWPYFPLRRDGGGLTAGDDRRLRQFVADCHAQGMKVVLGLPPFPPVALVRRHPEWRVHPDGTGAIQKVAPREDDLGTRVGCNLGPWGDYLIEVCAELLRDYRLDGYSFDGNYHPAFCYCPACTAAYRHDRQRDLPARADLDDLAYREYLVWRGERLQEHYQRLQRRLKAINPDAVLMSGTVNAGRYGHFLTSPRSMPTQLNRLFDLPMQEWWLDETNLGASVAPTFGAAYLKALAGDRPCASEAYLMSRGNPYGTDSFPVHERLMRSLLALSQGNVLAESFGWPGHAESTAALFRQTQARERWLTRATPLPWAGLLVSEQTRQFYAYKDIAERFLPHVFGAFRCALEEHLPVALLNDWDLDPSVLGRSAVLVLANAAALSDAQVKAVREYVHGGGGLVATAETSLFDQLGRPRPDFALADLFGVSYDGRPQSPSSGPKRDAKIGVPVDEAYWKQRIGVATLTWTDHPLVRDARLRQLVPARSATFRGPLVRVSRPKEEGAVALSMSPQGQPAAQLPAVVLRPFGNGRVVYFAAAVDAALWSYAYPYQRRLLARALEWAAGRPPPVSVRAPMCVQASYFLQADRQGKRLVVHLFNGLNTAANHGLPAMDVPLREESIPVHGVQVCFARDVPAWFHLEPGNHKLPSRMEGGATVVEVSRIDVHSMVVGEY